MLKWSFLVGDPQVTMVGNNTKSYYNEMMSEVPPFLEKKTKAWEKMRKMGIAVSLIFFLGVLGIQLLCFLLEDPSKYGWNMKWIEMAEIRCWEKAHLHFGMASRSMVGWPSRSSRSENGAPTLKIMDRVVKLIRTIMNHHEPFPLQFWYKDHRFSWGVWRFTHE